MIAVLVLLVLGANSLFNFFIVEDTPVCIKDSAFLISANLNHYMSQNKDFKNFCLIISSIILDGIVILTSYAWIKHGKNWRPIMTLILFYSLKFLCNFLFSMKFPEGMLWEYPGFPSLIVSYQKTVDFFYSGYIGLNLICCFELYKLNMKLFSALASLELIFQSSLLLILKANYLVDIIASLFAAHYFCYISEFYSYKLDNYINLNFDENKQHIGSNKNLDTIDSADMKK